MKRTENQTEVKQTLALLGSKVDNLIETNNTAHSAILEQVKKTNGTTGPLSKLTVNGHIGTTGPIPTISACGTSPAITTGSTDTAGEVTEGSAATGCVVTFASAYTNAPFCTVTEQSGGVASYTLSTTAITVTNIGALSSTNIDYHCVAAGS
jgi:hypothetical protein